MAYAFAKKITGCLLELVDVQRQARFQVGGFPPVNLVALGEFVQLGNHLRKELLRFRLVFGVSQLADEVSRCFAVKPVLEPPLSRLPDSLDCRFVMCHVCLKI